MGKKMNPASLNLFFARFALPHYTWKAAPYDEVENEYGEFFDIETRRAQQYVAMKLERDFGWKIRQLPSGSWQAKHRDGTEHEMPELVGLLKLLVETAEGGK